MPTIKSRKELTHDRIVRTASRVIRRSGYDGVGVADIMKEAGLTHGGFYAHFPSRTALLAEASHQAGADSLARLRKLAETAGPAHALDAVLEAYLAERHVGARERGCPIAALGSEMPRQDAAVRHAATLRIEEMIAFMTELMPPQGETRQHAAALGALSCMVGALVLARAVDDAALSTAVRDAGRAFVSAALD